MIYDCFTFFNEHDLLELRLRELDPVVDRFVIVEADRTHQGAPKPLYFAEAAARYRRWEDKIIHVVLDDMPRGPDAWERERYQRTAILRGLADAMPDDLIVVADLDEIPRREILKLLDRYLVEPTSLQMMLHLLRFNLRSKLVWSYTKAVRRAELDNPAELRLTRTRRSVPDAGWHLSYIGDREFILRKLKAFAHTEVATDRYTSPIHIDRSIRLGVDPFGHEVLRVVDADDLPASLEGDVLKAYLHPGRSPWQFVLAHGYRIVASNRRYLPNALTDHLPALAFVLAMPLSVMQRVLTTFRAARQASRRE